MEKTPRFFPSPTEGLSSSQVDERICAGLINTVPEQDIKTNFQIFRECVLTPFNLLCIAIAVSLLAVGATRNIIFMIVIFFNTVTRVQQELTSRKLTTSLKLVSTPKAKVIRDGQEQEIHLSNLVLDDIIILEAGQQIGADAKVLSGEIEADESVLTGESDAVIKKEDSTLLSGSYVISGRCFARVEKVGRQNYANRIAEKAQSIKNKKSELKSTVDLLTSPFCLLVVPIALGLFWQSYGGVPSHLKHAVTSSATAALGMLPIGPVLLIGLSLAAGFIRLSMKRVLLQNPYALESLAHVDVLCLDKTGTLTEGKMHIEEIGILNEEILPVDFHALMGAYVKCSNDNNATFQALAEYFPSPADILPESIIPFSSARKWSAVTFKNVGTLVVGAPDWIQKNSVFPENFQQGEDKSSRIIMIAFTTEKITKECLPPCTPVAVIALNDPIREGAAETLKLLEESGIAVKIISGDHPQTVVSVAKKAGLAESNRMMDFSGLSDDMTVQAAEDYTVFARVSPYQKYEIIKSLQADGHVVAMIGDGVNDILALREADCSTTVANGTDAARQLSQVVLLKSDFSVLPDLLNEGRRTMNNITRAASIFFIKTFYSIILAVICLLTRTSFPFNEVQITFLDWVIEGFPSFVMSMERDFTPSPKSFLRTSVLNALPNAITVVIGIMLTKFLGAYFHLSGGSIVTISYIITGFVGYLAYLKVSKPFNWTRILVAIVTPLAFATVLIFFRNTLGIILLRNAALWVGLLILGICFVSEQILSFLSKTLSDRIPWAKILSK